jgi:4-deoxy-L-threo-5-hexosulose-uronate ketol-isomerase
MTLQDVYETRWAVDPVAARSMDTAELRQHFLIETLFVPDRVKLVYSHYDRLVVGGAQPLTGPLRLDAVKSMGTANFLDRREAIAMNIGGPGTITAGAETFEVGTRDMVYLGKGNSDVLFRSDRAGEPAKFYLLSAPAHSSYPNRLLTISNAKRLDLGASETCNQRSIFQYIHPEADVKTCQLIAGITTFSAGSVWNTMPPHVHDRRMEAYLYFDLPEAARVFHVMGEPQETRHLLVANEQAVISPAWSIHSGVGTASYAFVWGMAGDNVDYADIDPVRLETLR